MAMDKGFFHRYVVVAVIGVIVIFYLLFKLPVLFNAPGINQQIIWEYAGDRGMEHWGELSPDFILCASGSSQSPIDLSQPTMAELAAPQFFYRPSPLRIINDGHSLRINYDRGSYMVMEGERYDLLQFHFHYPSEHQINGYGYPMEVHLVHRHSSGKLAVVAIFLNPGANNPLIEQLWDSLRESIDQEFSVPSMAIDVNQILPDNSSFYRYGGSLTTPPCTEGVQWLVFTEPITLSQQQINNFHALMPPNARSRQPLHNRLLLRATD